MQKLQVNWDGFYKQPVSECSFPELFGRFRSISVMDKTSFAACHIDQANMSGCKLAGIDLSDCEFGGLTVEIADLQGCIISQQQVSSFIPLLGVMIKS